MGFNDNVPTVINLGVEKSVYLADKADNATITKDIGRELIGKKERKAMITFVDDDCRAEVLTKWGPILAEKGMALTLAVPTNLIGTTNYLTWDDLKALKSLGVETASHSHTHATLTSLTEAQIVTEMSTSKQLLIDNSLDNDYIVYPYGSEGVLVRKIARRYFKGGVDIQSEILNVPPVETYRMERYSLELLDLAGYQAKIDQAIANKSWLIFMSHSQYPTFDEAQLQHTRGIIDYARANDVDIVSLKDGYSGIGNIIDTGDYPDRASATSEYTILDADGVWTSKSNHVYYKRLQNNEVLIDTPISYFAKNKVSFSLLIAPNAVGFPTEQSGILETRRDINSDSYSYQTYQPYNSNATYRRTCSSGGVWGVFEKVMTQTQYDLQNTHIINATMNAYTNDALCSTYPLNKITVFAFNNTGATGFPITAGIVTTHRISSANWNRQELRAYQSNAIWSRYALTADGTWSAWAKISVV